MEEIKLWTIDGSQVEDLKSVGQTETEKLLEDTLVNRPELLLEDLILVGRQTPTEGGPLDLLGVDGDGRLVVFELKRGTLSRDAVAQVIDYVSFLDAMELDDLADYISQKSGNHGIDKIEDFQGWYTMDLGFDGLDLLKPLRIFLVGLGVDDRTERMVKFLAQNSRMDISLLTFHGFNYDGKTILAKQVEIQGVEDLDSDTKKPPRRRRTNTEILASIDESVDEHGIRNLFDSVRDLFRDNWASSGEKPRTFGLNVELPGRTPRGRRTRHAYTRIDPNGGRVRIVFYSRAVELSEDAFRRPIKEIPYETWPQGRKALEDAKTEIQFLLTPEEWEIHKEKLTRLVQSLYQAWQNTTSSG